MGQGVVIWSNLGQLDDFSWEFGIRGYIWNTHVKQKEESRGEREKRWRNRLPEFLRTSFCSSVLCLSALPAPGFLKVLLKPYRDCPTSIFSFFLKFGRLLFCTTSSQLKHLKYSSFSLEVQWFEMDDLVRPVENTNEESWLVRESRLGWRGI